MKDLFSIQSKLYSAYRPHYPKELFDYISSFVAEKNVAWDCATGNGQAAESLANVFKKVMATDLSAAQLAQAVQKENIEYLQCPAERTPFAENTFDLITVAQAYHWLQCDTFCAEATRVAKPDAVIAIWMYDRFQTSNEALNNLMDHFYFTIVGPYWDAARKHIDNHYTTLPFPFEPLPVQPFSIKAQWTRQHIEGYLSSWSAVQHYKAVHHASPVPLIQKELYALLRAGEEITIEFPIYLLLGRVSK
jgi:ubiquinone/menaquinone biosynthesis C-methylase UbiE